MKSQHIWKDKIKRPGFRESGFTLVELLVSITIIAVLAAIVVGITGKVRSRAYQANAMGNLREIATANMSFASDNAGDIMTLKWQGDSKLTGHGGHVSGSYWGRLAPYVFPGGLPNNQNQLKNELKRRIDQFFGTSNASTMKNTLIQGSRIYHDTAGLPIPLSFNMNLYEFNKTVKTASFADPAQVIYATYGFGFFSKAHGDTYVARPRTNAASQVRIYYMDDKTALVVFLDGRVERLSPPFPERYYK